jgi:hypothetical protein
VQVEPKGRNTTELTATAEEQPSEAGERWGPQHSGEAPASRRPSPRSPARPDTVIATSIPMQRNRPGLLRSTRALSPVTLEHRTAARSIVKPPQPVPDPHGSTASARRFPARSAPDPTPGVTNRTCTVMPFGRVQPDRAGVVHYSVRTLGTRHAALAPRVEPCQRVDWRLRTSPARPARYPHRLESSPRA